MTKITRNKLISYSIIDFPSETHLKLGAKFFEEQASEFFNKAKKKGLLRWRMNRVWNKQGGFTLSLKYLNIKTKNLLGSAKILSMNLIKSIKKTFLL